MNPHEENSSAKPDSNSGALILSTTDLVPETMTILRDELWGDPCNNLPSEHNDILRLYCQNINGIFDQHRIDLDDVFHTMKTLGADIFTFNETQGDDTNPKLKKVVRQSENRILKKNNIFSVIHTSSSQAQVTGFTKLGGNMGWNIR